MSRIGHDSVGDTSYGSQTQGQRRTGGGAEGVVAGGLTGAISRMIFQPFDVLKIRFQLQAETKADAKYKSLYGASVSIAREEGVRALWKGHVSGQCLSVILASVQFGLYQALWQRAAANGMVRPSKDCKAKVGVLDVAFGAASAVPATIISYPFDVVRTRMVGQGCPIRSTDAESRRCHYRSTTEAFVRMAKTEGPASLYKGLTPALYTVPLQAGLHLCIYNYLKPFLAPHVTRVDSQNVPYLSQVATALLGGVSGVATKTLTFPLDTIKKRLQVQGFAEARTQLGRTPHYHGFTHCFRTIVGQEGPWGRGLFKGWAPAVLKSFPSGAVQFYLLETTMYLIARLKVMEIT